ncbi:MAG: HAMP domain-containing histidine kinase [Bdellovibrionaceae bacterium]|nr:HAMP domain-containing histidine kinase [Pseudobdellovibrionaceae bacterium]
MENSIESRFSKSRQNTDKNLIVERKKTDDFFETYSENVEGNTDRIVETGRRLEDKALHQRRTNADVKQDTSDANHEQNGNQIAAERRREDDEIKIERSRVDEALNFERDEKERLMSKLLKQEREETDKNLSGERKETDLETTRSAKFLKVEQTAHAGTKSALLTQEEFIAIVSHDLRNPIGTILSASELLLEDESFSNMNEEARRWIEIIKRNALTSLHLVSDILDMERIAGGKIQLRLAKNSINKLISEIIESYSIQAKAKSITLKSELLNSFDVVAFDKDRISQVLSNLVGNALKFTPANGRINVTAKSSEYEIEISVEDTGVGVPENQRIRIFERFAQIGNKQRSGIGLGLYISKTLVEAHLGKIWVISEPRIGSKFIFTLPKTL